MDSNYLRSSRAGVVTEEAIAKCLLERGHATPDMKDKCFMCGYKFTEEELFKKRDDARRQNLKVIRGKLL